MPEVVKICLETLGIDSEEKAVFMAVAESYSLTSNMFLRSSDTTSGVLSQSESSY